ncbi:MAG: HD domain-containing protein [Candidatus Amoebophilus sp.]
MSTQYIEGNSWKNFNYYLAFPRHIFNYSQKKIAQYGANYTAFAFFMTFHYMIPFFMRTQVNIEALYAWLLVIKLIGASLCVGLLLKPYWPNQFSIYFPIYWHLTLLYCLPFSFTLLFLINGSNVEWLVNVSLGITLLLVLVDWTTFLILSVLGTALGILFYIQFIGALPLLDIYSLYTLSYVFLASLSIGLIFARRKEQSFDLLLLQNQQLSEAQQKNREELIETLKYRQQLLQELKPEEVAIFDEVTTSYMKQAIYRMTDYMRLEVTSIALDELQQALVELYKYKLQTQDQPELLFKRDTKQIDLQGDFVKLKQLLLNSISYVQQYNTSHSPIIVAIEDAWLGHEIAHMQNYTRKLEALRITITTESSVPPTQPLYKIDPAKSSTWVPQHEDEFLLIENARIIDAHYGYIAAKSIHTQMYVLPVKLREIRGKVMELIKEPAAAVPEEVNHPLAIQLEQELMERLRGTEVDICVIQKGLDIIKRYHGGVKRKSGEPFFTHPMTVALILLEYSQDQDAILGALLHDTVEDTSLSLTHIRMIFGKTVEFLVAKATNLEDHKRRVSLTDQENLARILNYEDPRAALIKLSDRLHNMRTIQFHSSVAKRKYISQQTLDHFVPLARKLGLEKMAAELEQLSKEVVNKK